MATPQQRKAASEEILQGLGVPINPHLPLVEAEEDVVLRSHDELLHRLVALWAVAGSGHLRESSHFREYVAAREIEPWLSAQERMFLLSDSRDENDYIQFSWRVECIYFLAWCGGLIDAVSVPIQQSSIEPIMELFPQKYEAPTKLSEAIKIRSRAEIMNWADLLYRLHWAVRDSMLAGRALPGGVLGGAVQEWHLAVNWMTHYENEDNWDHVGTDT